MDLQAQLLESSNRKQKGAGKFSIASLTLHGLIIAFILFMSATATHKVDAESKMTPVFLSSHAAPPPPPPPPPPPAASSAPQQSTPKPTITPVKVPTPSFVQPTEIKELPKVDLTPTNAPATDVAPSQPSAPSGGEPGGVPGGVVGGVAGGVEGGVVGGTVGGVVGGTLGGVEGGTPGGTVGGTGEAKEPEPKPEGPLRVGGDVKAPVVTHRVEPQYTDVARKAHTTGIVIVEAVIDKDGNVDKVKVVKGLPMGLSEAAEETVRKWKFRPGTLNGDPVDVIFNLTVNFTLQ